MAPTQHNANKLKRPGLICLALEREERAMLLLLALALPLVFGGGQLLPSLVMQQCVPQTVSRSAYTRGGITVSSSAVRFEVLTGRRSVAGEELGLPEGLLLQIGTGEITGTPVLPSDVSASGSSTVGLVNRWDIPTVGAGGAAAFTIAGTNYLAVTNTNDGTTNLINSVVHRFKHATGADAGGSFERRVPLGRTDLFISTTKGTRR